MEVQVPANSGAATWVVATGGTVDQTARDDAAEALSAAQANRDLILVFEDNGSVAPSADTLGRLRYWHGHLYRTEEIHAVTKTVTFRTAPLGTSDLAAGETWAGVRAINVTPGPSTNGQVYFNTQLNEWLKIYVTGGGSHYYENSYGNANILTKFRGYADSEAGAKNLATAIDDIVGYGGNMYFVTAYTDATPAGFRYVRLDDKQVKDIAQNREDIIGLGAEARTAQSTADTAKSTADTAKSAADSAQTSADTAGTDTHQTHLSLIHI